MTLKKRYANAAKVSPDRIAGVLFYSDRSYTTCHLIGPKKIWTNGTSVMQDVPSWEGKLVKIKWSDLSETHIPDTIHVMPAHNYGYEMAENKVILLIPGAPVLKR